MQLSTATRSYLEDLSLDPHTLDIEFLQNLQSQHIARHSFNNLAVILGQELPLNIEHLVNKIVEKKRGGYCFEHNKLVYHVLEELGFEVKLILARVVYNRDIDSARTHRVTLLTLNGDQYIVDAGFGHLGARFPVKLALNVSQDQGDGHFRIIQKESGIYHYQVLKDGDFFTLYTFDKNYYTDADCTLGHFFSHRHPEAAFVNNLVISLKGFNNIHSLRNHEYFHIQADETTITPIQSAQTLYEILTDIFNFDVDIAVAEFLFSHFVAKHHV